VRIPLSWLADFVTLPGSVAALADRLTMAGLEVEGVEEVGQLDRRIRAGRLERVDPHPSAERLQVCRVDVGDGPALTVVSGAPGLVAGQTVPVALSGAQLPDGTEVAAVELRGVRSAGVLCSETELALGDDGSRVLALSADAAVGTPLVELPGIADTVVSLEITPNRGDWLSVLGVAREIAALTGARLRHPRPRPRESGVPAAQAVGVRVEAPDLCPRYCARLVRGVARGASPLWLRLRLRRAGMRAIDAIVDATNYVMLERGQPLHAFDFERVAGGEIVVRRATRGEGIVTLDGVERALEPNDLVIADPRRAIAIAGVMGGHDSEVSETTRVVLLESATFAPGTVRRTSRRLGLPSQAAYRFERRVDPAMAPEAVDAAAALITQLAGGHVAPGIVEDAPGLAALAPKPVRLRPARAERLLGASLTRAEITRRMRVLGAKTRSERDGLVVTPPSFRGDLGIEEDLVEEIARIGGYDTVPSTLPEATLASGGEEPTRALVRRVRHLLAGEGLVEMVTLSLTDAEMNRELPGFVGRDLVPIAVRNPLSSETGALRRSPLGGLLHALHLNLDRGASFVGAFELGKAYGIDAQGRCREPRTIAILLHGHWPPRGAERSGPPVDFLDLKGIVSNLFAGLGIDPTRVAWRPAGEVDFLHPGKAAVVELDRTALGIVGALHPETAQARDLAGEVWLAELDLSEVGHYVPRRVALRALPRFPSVVRDLAVVVDEPFRAGEILEEVRALGSPQIESVRLFDCYRGAPIPTGKKSLAYSIAYRAPDRTLTDDEVNTLHAEVMQRLVTRFRLEVRS
jgi:phenylalanyl-tRNA synthetase beta chain